MSFSKSSANIQLTDSNKLTASCTNCKGFAHHTSINLDQFIGNDNGRFVWDGKNFSQTARDVKLYGTKLSAELRKKDGTWSYDAIDLDAHFTNNDGNLQFEKK